MSKRRKLAHIDPKWKTKLIADASLFGLGALFIQTQNCVDRIIAYVHGSLSDIERRYSQSDRKSERKRRFDWSRAMKIS